MSQSEKHIRLLKDIPIIKSVFSEFYRIARLSAMPKCPDPIKQKERQTDGFHFLQEMTVCQRDIQRWIPENPADKNIREPHKIYTYP